MTIRGSVVEVPNQPDWGGIGDVVSTLQARLEQGAELGLTDSTAPIIPDANAATAVPAPG